MLKALIFDVDGTLAETEEAHREAFNRVFAARGLAWSWDQPLYKRLLDVTGGKERIAYYLKDFDPTREGVPADALADADRMKAWIAGLHAEKTVIYNAIIAEGGVPLRPGVEALLGAAKASGVRLAIATTTSLPNVESLLAATLGAGWRDVFETIAAGDQVKAKKPAPDVFNLALERLGLSADACMALEDSVNGLKSARAAALGVVITTSVYTLDQTFPDAGIVVGDLCALADAAGECSGAGRAILHALQTLHHATTVI